MTIRINQADVDFVLEKETTVKELAASLYSWAASQDLAVVSLLADGRAIDGVEPMALSEITTIEVEVVPSRDQAKAQVEVVADFFSLMERGLTSPNEELKAQLHQEFIKIRGALFPLLDPIASRLTPSLTVLDGSWDDLQPIEQAVRTLAIETESSFWELQNPLAAVSDSLQRLDDCLGSLADLGKFFQTGQDRDGFELILKLFTVLEDLSRRASLVFRIQNSEDHWEQFHGDLQPVLQETENALAAGDYILLTDLIEYELTPRLRSARSCFSELVVLDPASDVL